MLMRRNFAIKAILLLAISFCALNARAGLRNFAFHGTVTIVDDMSFQLDGSVTNGAPFEGYYIFESSTPDSNLDTTVGDYWHYSGTVGIVVKVGSYVFRTNPDHVDFLVEVVDRNQDNYLLRSYHNISSTGVPVDHISWQLDDVTGAALTSDALPDAPPILSAYQSAFGLTISGDQLMGYLIRGDVTSIAETPIVIPNRPEVNIAEAVELSFPTKLGYFYQVQYSFDLDNWTNAGAVLLGTGDTVSTFIRKPATRQTYYRAQIANTPN
jgi:hypothetical protein